ncbi:hypothetical protein CYMTET_31743 [Cymbomonas tetramitiformis]|uniref:Uncharacterized protein n=1 Tax=Cymbomonas tetramitiformis TaxID=36881 RepID=A0AAE0FH86_9CHLO|nr:hypothetical protein CYMTET_31743 [Cymbomonas tetramitiformis]
MEEEDLGATVEEKGTVAEEVARAREEMAAVAKVVTEAVKAAEEKAADSEAAVDWAVENTEVMAKVEVKMKGFYSSDGEEVPVPTETGSEAQVTADEPAGSEDAQPDFAALQPVPSAEALGDHEPACSEDAQPAFATLQPVPSAEALGDHEPAGSEDAQLDFAPLQPMPSSDTEPYSTDEETPTASPEHAATGCVLSLGVKGAVAESMYHLVSGTVSVDTLEFFLAKAETEGWDKQFIDVATLQWEVGHNVLIQPNVVALALGMIVDGLRAPCLNSLNRFMYRLKEEYCMKELLMLRIQAYDSAQWRLVKVHGGVHCFNECKNKLYHKGWASVCSLWSNVLAAEEFVMEYVGVVTLYPAISSSYVAKVEQGLYIDSSDLGNMVSIFVTWQHYLC